MSLFVQLGTTSVGYTSGLTTAVVSSNTASRSINHRPQPSQPPGVAKHRLPMQINRQSPQVNRSLQHANLPTRNIAALARPIGPSSAPVQQSATSPNVAGRVLASPVKDSTLDDDLLEGVVEKRPKYHKHLPLNYQYVLQDHNYGAPPPPTPNSPPKPLLNGVSTANGLARSQAPLANQQAPSYVANRITKSVQPSTTATFTTTATMSNVFGIGTRLAAPAEESDMESDGEREVDPQGEETETAAEGEDDEGVTRCICDFQHDDGYMICCDKCSSWQHVDCMGIDRSNIPDEYLCERCQPRRIDKQKAIALQMRKKKELLDTSDSSSDTSSSSETNVPLRKPSVPVNNRRRSEPVQRKTGTSAKQRRDSIMRQNNRQTIRKKQVEKRPPIRRKSCQPAVNMSADKCSPVEKKPVTPTTPVEQLRQWIDSYEEAVTNHYSPELRARIASIKVNGIHSDLKLPTNLTTTPKCRVSLLPSGIKILMACVSLSGNQPLLELRGKYMLCGSSRPPRPAATVPPPGPYIFHYKLPRDNTEVCVDARTYGNDARFVRRSCKPNAEMRHCIEKGALHLYLVTTKAIDKNTEIMLALAPGLACVTCGDHCSATPALPSPNDSHKSLNGLISPNNNNVTQITDKRRRGRRRTVSENLSPPKSLSKPTQKPNPPSKPQVQPKVSPTPKPTPKVVPSVRVPTPPPRVPTPPPPEPVVEKCPSPPPAPPSPPSPPPPAPTTRSAASNAARKPPVTTPKKEPSENTSSTRQQKKEAADKKNKMTREERKMEAIMKAFERMEKDQARRQEAQARQTQRKDSTETDSKSHIAETKDQENEKDNEKEEFQSSSRNSQRKKKFSTTKRKGRARSQSTPQPVLRPRRILRRSQPTRERSPDTGESSDESPERTPTPPAHPAPTTPTTPPHQTTMSYESPPHNQVNTSSSSGETPPTPMSKTAMLVAAAVGPLAPGFKFPKTKKGLINSWLKSPESSPPTTSDEMTLRGQGFGATKKRWLRQAISEECDSPNSRPDVSNSPTEHVAPPKKRRMARESVSEDHSFTPPTTPTHNAEVLSQCGSSQESEGPDSPVAPLIELKTEVETKMDIAEVKTEAEDTEESEVEDIHMKPVNEIKDEDTESKDMNFEELSVNKKTKKNYKDEAVKNEENDDKESVHNSEMGGDHSSAAAIATKRKLSISEYRQRKQQGPSSTGPGTPGKPDRPSTPNTSATSSLSSSSSDEEGPSTEAVIAKSLKLEAALDTNLSKKSGTSHLFDSAPTLVERQVERQRENLTQRLKREFGLFLSDDEEQEKARKQANLEVLNNEKDSNKKKGVPPSPPVESPGHYQLFFPGVGHPVYNNRYPGGGGAQPTASSFYTPPSTYYSQLPH